LLGFLRKRGGGPKIFPYNKFENPPSKNSWLRRWSQPLTKLFISVCLDDQQIDRSCPDGLHFSPYDQDCVDPSIANCKNDGKTCQSSDPFVPLFIPNSRNCRAYYICFNNVLHTLTCSQDQVFDRTRNICMPSGVVDCVVSYLIFFKLIF